MPCCYGSPLILDLQGKGVALTSPEGGVKFPPGPGASAVQIAWTDPQGGNGWLVLDRNGNGLVDDLSEMFGAITPQPESATPNGFSALAVFDSQANGGNGNGAIDIGDAVFKRLRIWVDANHDGKSQRGELFTLSEVGVISLGLDFARTAINDRFSNDYRYSSVSVDVLGSRAVYDVFLRTTTQPKEKGK